jgi:flagellar basal-body rod modification protein FlgD
VPVDPVTTATSSSMYATAPVRAPKQDYDGELFMELLVTQLRNQDPSASMDTSEIVSQTTSLAMMEALNTMSDLVQQVDLRQQESFALQMRSTAADLLGNQVSYLDDKGVEHTGTATAVSFHDSVPTVTIDGVTVDLDQVSAVTSTADGAPADPGTPAAPDAPDGTTSTPGSGDAA